MVFPWYIFVWTSHQQTLIKTDRDVQVKRFIEVASMLVLKKKPAIRSLKMANF